MWFVIKNKILTKDKLEKRVERRYKVSVLWLPETIDHLFLNYPWMQTVWF